MQAAFDYHSDYSRVSKTMLNLFCTDRVKYQLTYVTGQLEPPAPSRQMDVGSIVHSVVLDGGAVADMAAAIPAECLKSNGAINPGPLAILQAQNPSLIYLKDSELQRVNEIIDAIKESELWPLIRGATSREKAIFWTDAASGLECRAKPDFVCELDRQVVCYDLKISSTIAPFDFQRTAKRLRYWLQDAHYSAGIRAKTDKPVTFRFAVVEDRFPYRLQWYSYDESSRENAAQYRSQKMAELASCQITGDWSNNWDGILTLGPWDMGSELEMVEFSESAKTVADLEW